MQWSLDPRHSLKRRGMTLVEVVAALMLSATALVGVLIAYGRAVRQQHVASLRLEAVQVADELLAEWFAQSGSLPTPELNRTSVTGVIKGDDRWIWRFSKLESTAENPPYASRRFNVSTYQLEIIAKASGQVPQRTLVTMELVGSIEPIASVLPGSPP